MMRQGSTAEAKLDKGFLGDCCVAIADGLKAAQSSALNFWKTGAISECFGTGKNFQTVYRPTCIELNLPPSNLPPFIWRNLSISRLALPLKISIIAAFRQFSLNNLAIRSLCG